MFIENYARRQVARRNGVAGRRESKATLGVLRARKRTAPRPDGRNRDADSQSKFLIPNVRRRKLFECHEEVRD
jgi:hypothetical protein